MRSLKILIAEDDDQNQAMLKLILAHRGHNVKSAWTGLQALNAVKAELFDVVLMDVHMPEMDGLEATRQIRIWENQKQHVPIVILTGSVPPQVSQSYKTIGADTFLAKPFDVKRLDALINVFASEELNLPKEMDVYKMDDSIRDLPTLDESDALVRFGGDMAMYHENLAEFVRGLPVRMQGMRLALLENRWEDVSLQAHNLKGVSANFGAKALSQLAWRLDDYSHKQEASQVLSIFEKIDQHLSELNDSAAKIINQNKL